jgi:CYTH domain-containing protein
MGFLNRAGNHPDNDAILTQELTLAGIEVFSHEFLRKENNEVVTSVRGHLHGWEFVRSWRYWEAKGPGLDVETAEALHATHGHSVRVDGHGACPSPREHFKGLACGFYHIDDQEGLNALARTLQQLVAASSPGPAAAFAETNSVGKEIERKFLVKSGWREQIEHSAAIRQGYLNSNPERTVRVRVQDGRGVLTIKGPSDESGEECPEMNKQLTLEEANFMFALCEPGGIDKTRHFIRHAGHLFEVDEFWGENEGLVVAEISFKTKGEDFTRPEWLGEEVTGRAEYYNSSLAKRPYKHWGAA